MVLLSFAPSPGLQGLPGVAWLFLLQRKMGFVFVVFAVLGTAT
jgi:hypothetical protein